MNLFVVLFLKLLHGESFTNVRAIYYLEQAKYFGRRGVVHKAIQYCTETLKLDVDNFYALAGLATASVQKKDYRLALDYANKAILSSTKNVSVTSREQLHVLLAVVSEMMGKSDSLKSATDRIAALHDGDFAAVYARLGRAYFDFGIHERARHYYEEVRMIYPNKSAPYYNLARVYISEGDVEMAKQELMKALNLAEDGKKRKQVLRQLELIGRIKGESPEHGE